MKLAMLDKGTKVVAVREVSESSKVVGVGVDAHVKERVGKLIKAHIAPPALVALVSAADVNVANGRLMVLVVKWHGWHDKGTGMGTGIGIGSVWHKPMIAVYVGCCNTVISGYVDGLLGEGKGEASVWDVAELIRLEGSVKVADSVRHVGQLVAQSLVGG